MPHMSLLIMCLNSLRCLMNELNFNCSKRRTLNFAIFLLLYETTTYIANDMIMPGMLNVVESFHADDSLVSTALTAFILGGASLQIFLGPISDHIGRRPVLLFGVAFFVISSILIGVSQSGKSIYCGTISTRDGFMFYHCSGLCRFTRNIYRTYAVRLFSIMSSLTILAPLLGPLLGAVVIYYFQWRIIFLIIAVLASIAFFGIASSMPETVGVEKCDGTFNPFTPLSLSAIKDNYMNLLINKRFVFWAHGLSRLLRYL